MVTGNPIRNAILDPQEAKSNDIKKIINKSKKERKPLIYITGGSQGSHVINLAVEQALDQLTRDYLVIHQTGDSKYQDYERLESKISEQYYASKWINADDVGSILDNAKLVVSRAGANSLSELAYKQIPTIVVPIPYLHADEQNVNAKFFHNAGLCQIITQKQLTAENLTENINKIMANFPTYKKAAENSRSVVILDAAKKITQQILILQEPA